MKHGLPQIKSKRSRISSELENTTQLKEEYNPFKAHMEKVIEVKIYLKYNFHKNDIDDNFISDLEQEYAIQFLNKMEFLPTKLNIQKLLKLKPIEQCDFHLSQEQIRSKQVKLIHIYPNAKTDSKTKTKLKLLLSNEAFEDVLSSNQPKAKDVVSQIKKREVKKEEIFLFQRETVDNMISKAKDDIIDKQLYSQTTAMNDKKNLTIELIREKYLNPNAKNILEINPEDKMNAKAKFQNIDKAQKKDILLDTKYEFKYLDVPLTKDLLDEVTRPMDIPVEIIMKDVNFILDNFPIEELVDIEKDDQQKTGNKQNSRKQLYYKIKSITKEDIIYVYKRIQTQEVYRIIGLTVNLLYWIVFGFINRFQIDKPTKQFLYFKLLQEISQLESEFNPRKLFNKIFMPLLILIVRIECENIFTRKFSVLFSDKENKKNAMEKVNELITVIFDPHCYYNTFTIIGGNTAMLKHKLSKKILPKYKSKTYVTSNLVDQLFSKFKALKNVVHFKGKIDENEEIAKEFKEDDWEREKKYIGDSKVYFFRVLFNKVNQNLKKRNLDPIFTVLKEDLNKLGNKEKDFELYQMQGTNKTGNE